jgi:hypothetical protein
VSYRKKSLKLRLKTSGKERDDMSKKYPMMVTVKEASKIYRARAKKYREKKGWLPILAPSHKPTHLTAKRIRRSVTLVKLRDEVIKV